MPLNRDALALDSSPSAVAVARRWVAEVCRDLGREDLIDTAELGVSELVTNAILHGRAPVDVRVRGTATHPRIEVFDASQNLPAVAVATPSSPTPVHHTLETYGRGLSLVAMSSAAWGSTIEEDGKVVWFEPSTTMTDSPVPGVFEQSEPLPATPVAGAFEVRFLGIDATLFRSVLTHYSNLRRELRLLAVAHDADYPVARDLSPLFNRFEHQFCSRSLLQTLRDAQDAVERDRTHFDISLELSPGSIDVLRRFVEMLDVADTFCASQQLLSLARSPEQRTLVEWMLDEFVRQADGQSPTPCPELTGRVQA